MSVKIGLKKAKELDYYWDVDEVITELENQPANKGEIVFYGPSNFTRWGNERFGITVKLRDELLGKSGKGCAINRGFGSSCAEHQLYYYPRVIRPLEPKVLVYSPWGNQGEYSDEETWEIAQRVIAYAFADFPDIHVYLQSSNRRKEMSEEEIAKNKRFNSWLKAFAENTPNCFYVDTFNYEPLSNPDIFVKDGVHFNNDGYKVYSEFYREVLKDELAKD